MPTAKIETEIISLMQHAVADRLRSTLIPKLADAVVREDAKDVFTDVEKRLSAGLLILVTTPDLEPGEVEFSVVATVAVEITEQTVINRGSSGSRVFGPDVGALVIASLRADEWRPGDVWTPLRWRGFKLAGGDAESRTVTYVATFETSTLFKVV